MRVIPGEVKSVTESPVFLSTTGGNSDFLHLDATIATQIESGGATISSPIAITDDFDAETRSTTPGFPDIGADEFSGTSSSQTFVINVTGAEPSTNGNYSTLKAAFDAINLIAQTGNSIVIKVGMSTAETATAALNAGAWTSIIMYPTNAGKFIGGNLAAPLINLNGASNVTIDGRVNQSGVADLTLINTNTGGNTLKFINGASNNKIQYCNIKGATASTTEGVIFFSTSSTSGNSGNKIDSCDITNSGTRPLNTIYSLGSSGYINSNDTISNCHIHECFNLTTTSGSGVWLSDYNSGWIITGNSFYEAGTFNPATYVTFYPIRIASSSATGITISNNYIGVVLLNVAEHL